MKLEKLLPFKIQKKIESELRYAGIEIPPDKFLNTLLKYALSFGILLFVIGYFKFGLIYSLLFFLGGFFGFLVIVTLLISFIADRKGKFAEEVLPDVLQLIASNIRSGLTPDKAIILAARPEFGILEKEIKIAAKKALAGYSLEDALLELGKRIKSRIVERTFMLIAEGMRKGGEIAELLESTAEDIRNLKLLKKEITAEVAMYAIFIFLAIGIAAPVLFAFTTYLMETMCEIGQKLNLEEIGGYGSYTGGLTLKFTPLDIVFIRTYSFLALALSSLFGGMLIGLLQEGSEKAGIKYIPILLLLNFSIYFGARYALVNILSSFITGVPSL